MTTMSNTEIAKAVCANLTEYNGRAVPTKVLLRRAGVPETLLQSKRSAVLKRLQDAGVLERTGQGKFRWRLLHNDWNRDNPFRPNGAKPTTTKVLPVEEPNVPAETDPQLLEKLAKLEGRIKSLESTADRAVKVLEIKTPSGVTVKLKNVVLPETFERVLDLAKMRRNILLVGPAGCGKTHLGKLIADALGLDFGSLSCTSGMSEAHLLGRAIPNLTTGKSKFVGTEFLRCYEEGGVFLLDEIDAADPNLLLAINSAIANGYCNVPNRTDKPKAIKHEDFVMIATANTFGRGATRAYAGRNQLDEATIDRFRIGTVECYYDELVERHLCPDDTLRNELQSIRKRIEVAGLRRIMSTRFMLDAYAMFKGCNWTIGKITAVFTEGWTADEKAKLQ